jgi:hypothetical protein
VDRRRGEGEKVVDMHYVRTPSFQLTFYHAVADLIPRRAEANCPLVGTRDHAIVENERPDLMPTLGEEEIFGLSGLVLSAANLVFIVDG